MDMRISGAGVVGAGEYDNISIAGSGVLQGSVRCGSFHCSGSANGEGELNCAGELRVSGAMRLNGRLTAGEAQVSGAFTCEELRAEGNVKLSGGVKVAGMLAGKDVRISGGLQAGGGIEAENFTLSGSMDCGGLLNAERVELRLARTGSTVQAIGGADVIVEPGESKTGFLGGLFRNAAKKCVLTVRESVEADDVLLQNTVCPLVTGSRVTIGKNCRIDLVRYSESLTVDPEAHVGGSEKI